MNKIQLEAGTVQKMLVVTESGETLDVSDLSLDDLSALVHELRVMETALTAMHKHKSDEDEKV
jgi:hypothetical protein